MGYTVVKLVGHDADILISGEFLKLCVTFKVGRKCCPQKWNEQVRTVILGRTTLSSGKLKKAMNEKAKN